MTTEATHTDRRAGGTTHAGLQAWVDEVAAMTTPDHIEWVTGSDAEWTRLTEKLVEAGTFVRLDERIQLFHIRKSWISSGNINSSN